MTDPTKVSGRKPRRQKTSNAATDDLEAALRAASVGQRASINNPAWRVERPAPWPFKAQDISPLAWWRTLPSDLFRDPERLLVLATLDGITVLNGGAECAAALKANAIAAIGLTLSFVPITEMTLKTDIAMTALLGCALAGDAAAALVLAQIVGLTDLGHAYGTELAASWYTHGLRHSANPRKFSQAGTTLLAALRKRERDGDRA
jgi:hypothetical protein